MIHDPRRARFLPMPSFSTYILALLVLTRPTVYFARHNYNYRYNSCNLLHICTLRLVVPESRATPSSREFVLEAELCTASPGPAGSARELHHPPHPHPRSHRARSVVVSPRTLSARGRRGLDAELRPAVELPVARGLARLRLVVRDGQGALAVRRRAQRVPAVREEVERRRVRHDLFSVCAWSV